MPKVTVTRAGIGVKDAAEALQKQLGEGFRVEPREGSDDRIRVETSTLVFANVRMVPADSSTDFHVHGGGFLIGRALNEMSIARKVAAAIRQAPGLGA